MKNKWRNGILNSLMVILLCSVIVEIMDAGIKLHASSKIVVIIAALVLIGIIVVDTIQLFRKPKTDTNDSLED